MKSKERLLGLVMVILGIFQAQAALDRPNVVWLISEDNSKHYLKLFDERGTETPAIASMAQNGLRFERAFSTAPVCSVARTTLMTGCYAPRIGTQFHRRSVTVPLPGNLRMFPFYLRQAGYFTSNNQKKDYNAFEGEGVWDESSRRAHWRNRPSGQPFFHMQSFAVSHESSLHFPASDVTEKPTEHSPASIELAPYHPDTKTFRYTHARYLDQIQKMDSQIGAVLKELEDDGLLEDTFVFYFGDHGGVLPRGKGFVYETGLHVPLVVRIPENWKSIVDRDSGESVSGFVSFIDFGPTVLNLAGIPVPDEMDGKPFLGKGIQRKEVDSRQVTFGYADRFDEKYDLVRTIRKGHLKYMRSYQPFHVDGLRNNYRYQMAAYREWLNLYHAGKLNSVQSQFFEPREPEALYDLNRDPHETMNLKDDPAYSEALVELRGLLRDWVVGMPDLSFYPESVLVEKAFSDPVGFGSSHQRAIAEYVRIADLSLSSWEEIEADLDEGLNSCDPWQRYWGWIVCSSFGAEAQSKIQAAQTAAWDDPERLVRIRAAEFLGLIHADDPRQIFYSALESTASPTEALLILNSLVGLRDQTQGFAVQLNPLEWQAQVQQSEEVQRRVKYLRVD